MEAEGKHDFVPSDPGTELAFRKGDKLLILNYGEPVQWYKAEMNGRVGLVPENYIDINTPTWYRGQISRSTAEALLQGNQPEGAFLVRLSESSPQDFSLSVKCGNSVQHFRILKDSEHKYFLWSARFYSLNELVDHYRNETFVVVAMYDFESAANGQDGETELEFKKGDVITVFDTSDDNWWGGRIGDRSGYFPRLYVSQDHDSNNMIQ